MKRKDARDNAPGDLVRKIEALTGSEAAIMDARTGKGVRVALDPCPFEVEFTSPSSRFRVITSPELLREYPPLLRFLSAHAIGGVVTGFKVMGGDLAQWFDIMPRYAADFVGMAAECAHAAFVKADPCQRIDRVPGGFYEALAASQWIEVDVTSHPAFVNPAPVSLLQHVDGHTAVLFAEDGVWLRVSWPFENCALVKMVKAMAGSRCLVDKGPAGWHAGHWDDHGAKHGDVYVKWEASTSTLISQLRTLKQRRKTKAKRVEDFDPRHPKPTHYNFTVH
ncbi:hypothetical protein [Aeromonas phage 3]|nr:hypothetical protein [Aeromonas phage 3]